tara:strand:+ start:1177 stop:1500 length:324 start_codon:yes stop_codon:yes gene_type:complete
MSIPVIPNHPSSELKISNLMDSCGLNQSTNVSLKGLSMGTPSMTYTSNSNVVNLGFGGNQTIAQGYLANWLVANNLDTSFDLTDANQHKMSEFPVGRSCQSAGYLPR